MNAQSLPAGATVERTTSGGLSARRLLGLAAPLGPIGMAVWALAVPYHVMEEPAEWIPAVAAEMGRTQLSMWGLFVFALAAAAGAIVTGQVARAGSYRLGTVGMAFAFVGFSALNFNSAGYDAMGAASANAGLDVPTVERILAEADKFQAPMIGGSIFIPLMFVGVLLLGLALWRGRTVPRWAAAVLIAAFPVVLVGGFLSMAVNALGWVLMAIGFGAAGAAYARSGA